MINCLLAIDIVQIVAWAIFTNYVIIPVLFIVGAGFLFITAALLDTFWK